MVKKTENMSEILKKNKENDDSESYEKTFKKYKEMLIDAAIYYNSINIQFYLTFFTIFFFSYFTLTSKYINSAFENIYEKGKNNKWFLIWYYGGLGILFLGYCYYYYLNKDNLKDEYVRLKLIVSGIFLLFTFFNITQVFLKYLSIYLPDIVLRILLGFFLIFCIIFFVIYLTMFLLNINKKYNVEATISILLLLLFYSINEANVQYNKNSVYESLKKHDFNYATLNCFVNNRNESYNNSNSGPIYINQLLKDKGADYLEFKNGIPIKFRNDKLGITQDLILADFYYPGAYKPFLGDTPLNGSPDEEALIKSLTFYKLRVITLDIYSDRNDEFDPDVMPVVKVKDMKKGSKPLQLQKCFDIINEHAWIPNNNNTIAYPFFLILEFHFDDGNNLLYDKIRNLINDNFKKYLMPNNYNFNGYNGTQFLGKAKMKDCLGKIIIITNKYPVGPLNEFVNCSVGEKSPNNSITLNEYTQDMVNYDSTGVSQKFDKTKFTSDSKTKISFFYTNPNVEYKNDDQSKAGLFNPKFQDIAQYGAQGTLMHLFLPDPNLNKWYIYFKNKSNLDPILKDELLRETNPNNSEIKQQDEIKGIGKTQKYCMLGNSDYMTSEKTNIGTGSQNNSCDQK